MTAKLVTWQDVKDTAHEIAEELEDFTPAQEKLVIDMVNRRVTEARFRADTFDARRYYAAHWANMAITAPAGEGTQSSVGIDAFSSGVTLAVNNPPPDRTILETQYGRSYWHLMQSNFEGLYVG